MSLPIARILVVEDSKVIRDDICGELRRQNMYCYEAENGQSALTMLKNLKSDNAIPDLIVSDINMPELNGIQLLAKVREDADLKHIPFIVLTANKEELLKMAAMCLDVAGYFIKPPDFTKLRAQIERSLTHKLQKKN